MVSPDQRSVVSNLVAILRKITRAVQLLPFAYLLLLAVYLMTEAFLPDALLRISDNVFNTPILGVGIMLCAGRLLRLCSWFKAACLIPLSTKVEGYIDSFVFTFTQEEIIFINTAIGLLALTFLVLAYRHFFAHGK